jgi:uncharacterized protein (UPF0147 family)
MTETELNEALLTQGALALSTQYFLSALLKVLRDDGLVSQEQIRRAVENAKATLQEVNHPIRIRAAVLLEPSKGEI